jgi:hypothetical protein
MVVYNYSMIGRKQYRAGDGKMDVRTSSEVGAGVRHVGRACLIMHKTVLPMQICQKREKQNRKNDDTLPRFRSVQC